MDHGADAGDQDHHHGREPVNQHAEREKRGTIVLDRPEGHPKRLARTDGVQRDNGEDAGADRGADSYGGHIRGEPFTENTDHQPGKQRKKGNEDRYRRHRVLSGKRTRLPVMTVCSNENGEVRLHAFSDFSLC